jgi:hypothetical protein
MTLTFFSAFCILGITVTLYKLFNYKYFTHGTVMFDRLPDSNKDIEITEATEHVEVFQHYMSYPSWIVLSKIILAAFSFYVFFWITWIPSTLLGVIYFILMVYKGGKGLSGNVDYINKSYIINKLAEASFYIYILFQYT